jgi:hypothetical protein
MMRKILFLSKSTRLIVVLSVAAVLIIMGYLHLDITTSLQQSSSANKQGNTHNTEYLLGKHQEYMHERNIKELTHRINRSSILFTTASSSKYGISPDGATVINYGISDHFAASVNGAKRRVQSNDVTQRKPSLGGVQDHNDTTNITKAALASFLPHAESKVIKKTDIEYPPLSFTGNDWISLGDNMTSLPHGMLIYQIYIN